MMTDKICCNCKYYRGVNGCQGCAPCTKMDKMVLWNESCQNIWLIPKRMETGAQTNADRIRAMTDEELADFLQDIANLGGVNGLQKIMTWIEWLKEEVTT